MGDESFLVETFDRMMSAGAAGLATPAQSINIARDTTVNYL